MRNSHSATVEVSFVVTSSLKLRGLENCIKTRDSAPPVRTENTLTSISISRAWRSCEWYIAGYDRSNPASEGSNSIFLRGLTISRCPPSSIVLSMYFETTCKAIDVDELLRARDGKSIKIGQ